jgi:hypothetical protein
MSGITESALANRLRPYWLADTARGNYASTTPIQIGVLADWGTVVYGRKINLINDGVTAIVEQSADDSTQVDVTLTATGGSYDIGDGYNGTIVAGTTEQMLYFTTARSFDITGVSAYCEENDVTINIYATNGTYPDIVMYHDSTWTITTHDPSTNDEIETYTSLESNSFSYGLTTYVSVTGPGELFHSEVVAGVNGVMAIGYGLSGMINVGGGGE